MSRAVPRRGFSPPCAVALSILVSLAACPTDQPCSPDCQDRRCGDDGCGGSCGDCEGGQVCDHQGTCGCEPRASAVCSEGDLWWLDSCGLLETMAEECEHGCEADACTTCVGECGARQCGDDGCGGSCGSCTGGQVCDDTAGTCACAPRASSACHDGDLWWFDSCGELDTVREACPHGCQAGACLPCTPECGPRVCGLDPVCEAPCGDCDDGLDCVEGSCVTPDCREVPCPEGDICDRLTGACRPGCQSEADCDDSLSCTQDLCLVDGNCQSVPVGDCDWPAEGLTDAENLTSVEGPLINDFHGDLSGAVWNPQTQTLWVCTNNGPSRVWALEKNASEVFEIAERGGERAEWEEFGDAEGLTLISFDDPNVLYVVEEGPNHVSSYDFSTGGTAHHLHRFATGDHMPPAGNDGAEGIAFVPDAHLEAAGFVTPDGQPYTSTQGMNGIVLIGHQSGGRLYAFDLNPTDGTLVYLGEFLTDRDETAGLELDRSTGLLYIWHGDGNNILEVARLSSAEVDGERKLDTVATFVAPEPALFSSDNYEGIAMEPADTCVGDQRSFFLAVDSGNFHSLIQFLNFPCL